MTTPAIRTVSETDDVHIIEGLGYPFGGPFNGSDSYGTRFTKQTNFYWSLYHDTEPAVRAASEPGYVRPMTYQHGFDPEVGLLRVGGYSAVRMDAKGIWVQAQLDKHNEYYSAIRDLLDQNALGFSGESSEHAVRVAKNGDVLEWPAGPMSLTPIPSNPWAVISVRAADTLRIVEALRADTEVGGKMVDRTKLDVSDFAGPDRSYPITDGQSVAAAVDLVGKAADPEEVKANIIRLAKEKGLTGALPESWRSAELPTEAVRIGKTISSATGQRLLNAHDALAAVMGMECAPPSQTEPDADDAARSADALPTIRLVAPADDGAFRAAVLADVSQAAEERIRILIR